MIFSANALWALHYLSCTVSGKRGGIMVEISVVTLLLMGGTIFLAGMITMLVILAHAVRH